MKKQKHYKRPRAIARQQIRADVTAIMMQRRSMPRIRDVLKFRLLAFMARLFIRRPKAAKP